jgi:hypothetical protein
VDTGFAGSPFASEQRFTVPPAFRSIEVQPGDKVRLEFVGLPATAYSLESSTNMPSWTGVTNFVTAADGLFTFTVNEVSRSRARFFRAVGAGSPQSDRVGTPGAASPGASGTTGLLPGAR